MDSSLGNDNCDDISVFSSDTEDEECATRERARSDEASALREEGNKILQQGRFRDAVTTYKRALGLIWPLYRRRDPSVSALGAILDLNLALCYIRLEQWEAARKCTTQALEIEPQNAKGLYRRGVASARLGLLDAAEADLKAANALVPSRDTQKELAVVKERLSVLKGNHADARGFFQRAQKAEEAASSSVTGECTGEEEEQIAAKEVDKVEYPSLVADRDENSQVDWAAGYDVEAALTEINAYLIAIASRPVICASADQKLILCEQLEAAYKLLPKARASLQAAVIEHGVMDSVFEVKVLLERMAEGLVAFRPFFALRECEAGEFDSLRVFRDLTSRSAGMQGFDLELVRWGNVAPATPGNFAEAMFPPTGRPPNASSAAWQREVFFRIFQKDASPYVSSAVWMFLHKLVMQGATLSFEGRHVTDLGLAEGFFFSQATPEGPVALGAVDPAARVDSLAICTGRDKRPVVLPSFTSLGTTHRWLLMRFAVEETDTEKDSNEGMFALPRNYEVAVDLCVGALGLLEGDQELVSTRDASSDVRFVPCRVAWGDATAHLAQPPASAGSKGTQLMHSAIRTLLAHADLPLEAENVMMLGDADMPNGAEQTNATLDRDGLQEACRRLFRAISRLGLPVNGNRPSSDTIESSLSDKVMFETTHQEAVKLLCDRKLRECGLVKCAEQYAELACGESS